MNTEKKFVLPFLLLTLTIQALHGLRARKVAILGPGLIGCAPQGISTYGATNGSAYNKQLNDAVILFNNQFRPLVQSLNNDFPDATFTFIDMISIASFSAAQLALLNSTAPCCEKIPSLGTCKPNGAVCAIRDSYTFFVGFDPMQIVNQGLAARSYNKVLPRHAYPYDIHQLATM